MSTSMPCVNMFSACLICSLSLPLATCTFSSAPISLQCFSTRSLSRCQRSSFKVSIEKPILIGSFGPLFFLAPPLFVFVPDTQEPATRVKRNKSTIEVERRIEYFSPLQDWLEQIKLTLLSRRCTARAISCEHFGNQTRPSLTYQNASTQSHAKCTCATV